MRVPEQAHPDGGERKATLVARMQAVSGAIEVYDFHPNRGVGHRHRLYASEATASCINVTCSLASSSAAPVHVVMWSSYVTLCSIIFLVFGDHPSAQVVGVVSRATGTFNLVRVWPCPIFPSVNANRMIFFRWVVHAHAKQHHDHPLQHATWVVFSDRERAVVIPATIMRVCSSSNRHRRRQGSRMTATGSHQ